MLLPEHTLHKPASLTDCLAMLASMHEEGAERLSKVQLIAGGTDVVFNMRLKFFQPENLISVRRLDELAQLEALDDGSLRIGAACRLADLADDPVISEYFLIETVDPYGPFGAKEVGEGPIVVAGGAIAAAVSDALDSFLPEIPMTSYKVWKECTRLSKTRAAEET